jgi:hypothetical protein
MRVLCYLGIFFAGVTSSINLTQMKYGIPVHYDGQWWKFVLAMIIGLISVYTLEKMNERISR